VKGHCLVWGRDGKLPTWLANKSAEEVKEAVIRRVTDAVTHFKGRYVSTFE
jgi:GH35 family endo-1,4-beta-xylanase